MSINSNEHTLLTTLLDEFHELIQNKITINSRPFHFAKPKNKIKVAIGMRRTGKTYCLFEKINQLLSEGVPITRILYINFEDDRLLPLNREKLAALIDAFFSIYPDNHDNTCYLFLDEIQVIDEWSIVVRRFFDRKNIEIFLSGSSAKLLSSEIATELRGRSLATEVWPYSFEEYLTINNIDFNNKLISQKMRDILKQQLINYFHTGGFPEVIDYDQLDRQQTLQEYIDVVILRDIIERHNITNTALIKYMIKAIIGNVGRTFSINKFFNDLKSQGFSVTRDYLYQYFDHIEDTYLAFGVKLFSESIRKSQINPKKTYVIDSGLIKAINISFLDDLGHIFENLIYLDLRRQNNKIFYYLTQERYEVDFLAQDLSGKMRLIQVVWDTSNPKTLDRELRALRAAEKELGITGEIITPDNYFDMMLDKHE